jgi:hypothetical protein
MEGVCEMIREMQVETFPTVLPFPFTIHPLGSR